MGWGETQEYILMDLVSVPIDSNINKTFKLEDERLFTVKAESRQGDPLYLFEWTKGLAVYPDGAIVGSDSIPLNTNFYDPIAGDREIYLSNKPDDGLNADITLKYFGAVK